MKPLDSLFAIRLTRDRAAARRAIETLRGPEGQYEPRNAYERDYIAGTPARIEAARNQVALSAINALAVHLGSLADRRKTLVVVTEGIGRRRAAPRQEYLPTLDTIIRSANRANVAVYPFDPSDGARRRGARRRCAGSRRRPTARRSPPIADRRPAARRRRLERLLPARRSASSHPDDGKFRELEVRVKRPGVRAARAERYWARVAGRSAARGAAGADERAEARRAAGAGAARQHAHPAVVRRLARSRRQVARDVRLGAGGARARRPRRAARRRG